MRIGLDAKRLFNNFTGLGNYSRATFDMLADEYAENEYFLYTPRLRLNGITLPYTTRKGCRVVQPHGMLRGSTWRAYGLVDDMKRDGIELFHGLCNEVPRGLFHSGIASVVTIHNAAIYNSPDDFVWHNRKLTDATRQYSCNHSDRIVVTSEQTRQEVMQYYNVPEHKIDLVHQAANIIYYTDIPPIKKQPYILYVGTVVPYKHLMSAVQAIEMLPGDLQIPLVVVGSGGTYKQQVKQYTFDRGIQHLFAWPDIVSNTSLRRLYAEAQMLLNPSTCDSFPLTVLEALLSRCPVVTSNTTPLPQAVEPYMLTADPTSPYSLKEQIAKVLTDSQLSERMSVGGREAARNTFWPSVLARQMMDVYKKI